MDNKIFEGIDPDIIYRIDLIKKLGESGKHGEEVIASYNKYSSLPEGMPVLVEGVKDFLDSINNDDLDIPFIFYQYFLVLFRDTAHKDL